jgi:hypothetical protein
MRGQFVSCEFCGSSSVRRSRQYSVKDYAQMLAGTYPFRCQECSGRFHANIWFLSKARQAKCPRCLNSNLSHWPQKRYKLTTFQRILTALGARKYRCAACRFYFVSFLPTKSQVFKSGQSVTPEHLEDELKGRELKS